jgi:hypothetical protein
MLVVRPVSLFNVPLKDTLNTFGAGIYRLITTEAFAPVNSLVYVTPVPLLMNDIALAGKVAGVQRKVDPCVQVLAVVMLIVMAPPLPLAPENVRTFASTLAVISASSTM